MSETKRVIGYAGAHRVGKTWLANQLATVLREQKRTVHMVESPVSATFRQIGLDPAGDMTIKERFFAQEHILANYTDALERGLSSGADVVICDRTPIDLIAYLLEDVSRRDLSEREAHEAGIYFSRVMSAMYGRIFDQIFMVHPHDNLPFKDEPMKARNDIGLISRLDVIMTSLLLSASLHTRVTDLPRAVPLENRLTYVLSRLHPGEVSPPCC